MFEKNISLTRKRLLAIDFGLARVGVAITDELHISITPKPTLLLQKPDFWEKLIKLIIDERIGGIIVGIPYELDEEHEMREPIETFIHKLSNHLFELNKSIPIYEQDESYSSVEASGMMVVIGMRKKRRATKGIRDGIAAGIILRNFLNMVDSKYVSIG